MLDHPELNDNLSQISKMVKYIIEKNIPVHHFNVIYSNITGLKKSGYILRHSVPDLKTGRFTLKEDDIITSNWKDLCHSCNIQCPAPDMLRELSTRNNFNTSAKKRERNVIGCFLGQGLKRLRHCSDIFFHAVDILNPINVGKFSDQEDKLIIAEVENNGDNIGTWKALSRKLNRNPNAWYNMRSRYKKILMASGHKSGKWTLDEDTFLIERLFQNKPIAIETVQSVRSSDFDNITELKRKPLSIKPHFEKIIKPILMSYHYGMLGTNWKYRFLSYIVEQGFESVKQIHWGKMCELFPFQTERSLQSVISGSWGRTIGLATIKKPFYAIVQENLYRYKDRDYKNYEKGYRAKIVSIYTSCANPQY